MVRPPRERAGHRRHDEPHAQRRLLRAGGVRVCDRPGRTRRHVVGVALPTTHELRILTTTRSTRHELGVNETFHRNLSQSYQLILSTNQNFVIRPWYLIHQIHHYCILFHIYGATQSLFFKFLILNFFELKYLNNKKFPLESDICCICKSAM